MSGGEPEKPSEQAMRQKELEDVIPVDYVPDPPKVGGRYQQIIRIALIVLIVCLCIVAFGMLAQFAYHAVH